MAENFTMMSSTSLCNAVNLNKENLWEFTTGDEDRRVTN